jgi:hypothetical protein
MNSHHDERKAMEAVEQQEFLDSIVYSGTDALMLGCIDKVGQITYRQAIAEQNARVLN